MLWPFIIKPCSLARPQGRRPICQRYCSHFVNLSRLTLQQHLVTSNPTRPPKPAPQPTSEMLFIGTITRLIEGDRYRHQHAPAAYPAFVGVPLPLQHSPCSCRGDRFCSECSPQSHHVGGVVPMVAAAPALSYHDTRRGWRYERRAMRDSRRAARHGYGSVFPVAVPVTSAYGPSGYSRGYCEAGPSSSRTSPERRRDGHWDDEGFAAPVGLNTGHFDREQREASPPKYETGGWEPRRTSVEVLTEGKRTY